MKYVHDEEQKIKQILSDGFESSIPSYYELLLLAKYYRINDRLGQKGIENKLAKVLLDFGIDGVSKAEIVRASRKSLSYTTYKKPNFPIPIYNNDLEMLDKIHNFNFQKVILSTIVFSRATGNPKSFYLTNQRAIRHIISMSNTRISVDEYKYITYIAFKHKIFKNNYFRTGDGYSLMFEPDGDIVISISEDTYMSVGNTYREHVGGILDWCEVCGEKFVRSGRNSRYCDKHSKEMRKEKTRNRVKKYNDRTQP